MARRRHVALARTTVMAASGMTPRDQGLVGGGVNTTRQVGAALRVAVLVAIAGADPHAGVAAVGGERAPMFVAAMAGLVALLVAATELGRGSGSDSAPPATGSVARRRPAQELRS